MDKVKNIEYSKITKKGGDYIKTRSWHNHQRFQRRANFHYFRQKHESCDVTPNFLSCLNDEDISFLNSETSTELNGLFC